MGRCESPAICSADEELFHFVSRDIVLLVVHLVQLLPLKE